MLIGFGVAETVGLGAAEAAGTAAGEAASNAEINVAAIIMGMIRLGGRKCFAGREAGYFLSGIQISRPPAPVMGLKRSS